MDAVEFIKARIKMCNDSKFCDNCPMGGKNNGYDMGCSCLINKFPEKAVRIVERYLEENKSETYAVDVNEKIAEICVNLSDSVKSERRNTKVNICGLSHDVVEYDDHFDVDCHFGMIDYKNLEIRINGNMKPEAKEETICHEMIHGILVHIGRTDLNEDEGFVQALGNAIYQGFNIKEFRVEENK